MRLPVVLALILALTLSIIGPSPLEAVELPVSYLVDSRTLKRTTVLGDSLTFAPSGTLPLVLPYPLPLVLPYH